MKEDELTKYLNAANETLKKHAETINTLNKNQQVLVKKVDDFEKTAEINKKVKAILEATQASTAAAEKATPAEPAAPVEPAKPAESTEPEKPAAPAEPAKKEGE